MTTAAFPASDLTVAVMRDGDKHVFFLPRFESWSSGKQYRINGTAVQGGENYSTTGEPLIEVYHRHAKHVGARSKVEGFPDLTMAEYLERKDALGPTEAPQYDDEGRRFRDLDAEYAYKRFMATYEIETVEEWVLRQTAQLAIQDKITPPNPFIIPGRHLGEGITSLAGQYQRWGYVCDLVRRILAENGYVDEEDKTKPAPKALSFKIYTHEKNKISVYVGGSRCFEMTGWGVYSDTMEVVLAKMADDKALVERELGFFLAGTRRTVNAYQMANILEGAVIRASKIDSKVSTADEKRGLLTYLRGHIERLKAMEELRSDDESLAPCLAAP